jgi:hypothetical protein
MIEVLRVPEGFIVSFRCDDCHRDIDQPAVKPRRGGSKAADEMESINGDVTPRGWQLRCDSCKGRGV